MVGFHPESNVHLSTTEYAIAGASSGAVCRALYQPLDVLKIRFQLQIEPISHKNKQSVYHGLRQATLRIIQKEGVTSLWKGHVPAQFLSVGYGILQFTVFEILTKTVWISLPKELTTTYRPLTHLVCGTLSGSIAMTIVQPLDVLRTRFVAQGEPKVYSNLMHASSSILRNEGIQGFYKGLVPALSQIGPQIGFQFGLYTAFSQVWRKVFKADADASIGVVESLICGSGSGMVSKLLIYPLDVAKKRLQVQGFEEARMHFGAIKKYNGMTHCIYHVAKSEGLRGLFKGISPSLLKAAAVTGTNFCIYDQICNIISLVKR